MSNEVPLAVSAFLDSRLARGLPDPSATRDLAEAFFEACYGDLGKAPKLLDEHDLEVLLLELLPARLRRGDSRAANAVDMLEALLTHLDETEVVTHAWELRRALAEHAAGFEATVAAGTHAGTRVKKQATVAHSTAKQGRNDPCWCGSGKKFKKCCGANE